MNAHEIRYSPDAKRVALGWPGGVLAVHAVDPSDGAPAEELARVIHHKDTLIRVGWVDGDRLASVSEDGAWAISDAASGEVLRSGTIEGEYLSADLSPSGAVLFVYAYTGEPVLWRIDVADGSAKRVPSIDDVISVTSTVYATGDDAALLGFFRRGDDGVREGLAEVDLGAGKVTPRLFANGPRKDVFTDGLILAIDAERGIGIRPDYEPTELTGDAEAGHAMVRVELFDLATLERKRTIDVLGWPRAHLDGPLEGLRTAEPGSDDFADAQDSLIRKVTRAVFVPGAPHVWLGLSVGAVRRISLEGERDVPIFHGGGADTGPPSLNDVFARNLMNLHTLGVSEGGEYVGFGNPNDFFAVEAIGLADAKEPIRLPARHTRGPETESPGLVRFAGERLVVFDRGEGMHLADGSSGDLQDRVDLGQYYGEATDLAFLEDEGLLIAVSGGSALLWQSGELMELPFPPHSIAAGAVGPRFALVHHNGAVALFDPETEGMEAVRAPEDEGDPPDEEWDAFEQRWSTRGAAFLTIGGVPHAATVDENDDVQLYALEGASVSVGESFDHIAGRMAGGADWLAIAPGSEVRILAFPGASVTATHSVGQVGSLRTGDQSGALYVFDDESGELSRIEGTEREVVFTYRGASCPQVDVSERLDRIAVVTAAGPIELYALGSGEKVAGLHVEPKENQRVLVKD